MDTGFLTERRASARSLDDLDRAGLLPAPADASRLDALRAAVKELPVAITPSMLKLIDAHDPSDPIAAQFVPKTEEAFIHPDETEDPISDHPFTPVKGVVHRYPDRALLKLTLTCPVHCRFCFRRDQLGTPGGTLLGKDLTAALDYIAAHQEIWEVILTGGDPFILPDKYLRDVTTRLNAMPHVQIIRVHTRVPVVDPSRLTEDLITALKGRAAVYVLLHCNHPRELTLEARAAVARLVDAGIPMLSQSVLLRGVNDDPQTLEELMRSFVTCRIKPYYLHHADKVRGTSHFRVSLERGQELMRGLRGRVSGLAQPDFMLDIPGGHGKAPVGPSYVRPCDGGVSVEDYNGQQHLYSDRGE